jgi:hypothetical protein
MVKAFATGEDRNSLCCLLEKTDYTFKVADQNFDFKQFALGIRSCWLAKTSA